MCNKNYNKYVGNNKLEKKSNLPLFALLQIQIYHQHHRLLLHPPHSNRNYLLRDRHYKPLKESCLRYYVYAKID